MSFALASEGLHVSCKNDQGQSYRSWRTLRHQRPLTIDLRAIFGVI
jgi:hypothetical protein